MEDTFFKFPSARITPGEARGRQTDRQDRIHRRYREIEKQTIEGQGDKTHRWEWGKGGEVVFPFLFEFL